MVPATISKRIVADRFEWIDKMVEEINSLPLSDHDAFMGDSRNIWAAESCLRRALEALFDIGRYILAKGFGKGISEYKEIAEELQKRKVLPRDEAELLRTLAGYRNRLVHFYHEVTAEELCRICKDELGDVLTLKKAYLVWMKDNPNLMDETL